MEYSFKNNRIAELRKAQNLTQLELAEKIHTSQANLSRWEKGLNEPSIIQCWKIADFFEVSIDFLCGKIEYWLGSLAEFLPSCVALAHFFLAQPLYFER